MAKKKRKGIAEAFLYDLEDPGKPKKGKTRKEKLNRLRKKYR